MSVSDDLGKLTDDDLASRIVGLRHETHESLLAKWEWERRKAKAQHYFNMELMAEQSRLARRNLRIVVTASILATLLGAVVGGIMQWLLR
jgi:hypothetical protein